MSFLANKKKRNIFIISVVSIIVLAIVVASFVYLNTYYKADNSAIAKFEPSADIEKNVAENNSIIYKSNNVKAGLIFYPGGKVEYTAYEPLMKELASKGFMCILLKMPFNLAIFDINAADGIKEKYPEIQDWYIAGHSLGGAMASSYLAKHIDDYKGLILLGAYSTSDLSDTDLKVISIYGSEDKVMNYQKYNDCKANLPKDNKEIVINGGCHAYFGMYGSQDGDGTPTISNAEQIYITAQEVSNYLLNA